MAAALLLLSVVTVASGCSSGSDPKPSAAESPSDSASSGDPSSTSASPSPMLTSLAPARTPLGAGERAWVAFSQRGLSHQAWWARLKPLLSESARAVYVYDDPRNIPPMKVTATVHLSPKPPDRPHYTAEVVVPTSKGVFALDLERHTLTSTWLLYAIKFPRSVH